MTGYLSRDRLAIVAALAPRLSAAAATNTTAAQGEDITGCRGAA